MKIVNGLAHHKSLCGSVDRVSERWWVRFLTGTQILSLSHARDMMNITSFSVIYYYYLSLLLYTFFQVMTNKSESLTGCL